MRARLFYLYFYYFILVIFTRIPYNLAQHFSSVRVAVSLATERHFVSFDLIELVQRMHCKSGVVVSCGARWLLGGFACRFVAS